MVQLGDILNKEIKTKLYESVRKYVLDLPSVNKNSWDAFFIIIFLILISDKKVRSSEQDFFKKLISAIFQENWESSKLIRGKIPPKGRQENLAKKVLSIYEGIKTLKEDSIFEVVDTLSKNITDQNLQKITLLCMIRIAISDLELAKYERMLIIYFADSWEIKDILNEVKFAELREQPESNYVRDLLGNSKIIDRRALTHSQYEETVYLIHENGLNVPGDELVSEIFRVYRKKTDEKHEQQAKQIRLEHTREAIEKKQKYQEKIGQLNEKFKNIKSRFGTSFICSTFLPDLNFHHNSFDNLDDQFESADIWHKLRKLNSNEHTADPNIQNFKIHARKGWLEIKNITTGKSSLGRIYYHESKDERWIYHVYVDAKADEKSQKKAFKKLDTWKKNNFS
tara:strand:+ start:780 stop:1967 length:1188 start_codon:yes stop_codon:yes gene_type:complete